MGSRVPAHSDSEFPPPVRSSRIGQCWIRPFWNGPQPIRLWRVGSCAGVAALIVLFGSRGLESAEANGDTRTLTLHHLHTDEDITVTYKRDGRYDDEALKKLDHFLRDWRKDESIHMDPRLFDVVWEVSREFGKDKVIEVVCGYRSPSTNAMLRRRSGGVAQFSQHTLGKAMDFYIQGAGLEEIREAGLRLQRGGVGYYPTSGSPFVHLDVGNVRHWPRMTREQLVRVFPNGRTVHIPSDGQPLPGYALALADIQKRGSSAPSQMSLAAAQAAGIDTSSVRGAPQKSVIAWLFQKDDDEDDKAEAAPAPATTASAAHTYTLTSVSNPKADTRAEPTRTSSAARPQRTALAVVAASPAPSNDGPATPPERNLPRTAAVFHAPLSYPEGAPAVTPWPFRDADKDRVPLDMVLAYAAEALPDGTAGSGSLGEPSEADAGTAVAFAPVAGAAPHNPAPPQNATAAQTRKNPARAAAAPVLSVPVVTVAVATATSGMRYDDPWLRSMIVAPPLYGSMTTTLFGDRDLTDLRSLMSKPATAVVMSFSNNPYPGMTTNSFSGEAVVLLSTVTFSQRTAWLQQ
jgi:uncharacterized protein YcbK (DUF882 family)